MHLKLPVPRSTRHPGAPWCYQCSGRQFRRSQPLGHGGWIKPQTLSERLQKPGYIWWVHNMLRPLSNSKLVVQTLGSKSWKQIRCMQCQITKFREINLFVFTSFFLSGLKKINMFCLGIVSLISILILGYVMDLMFLLLVNELWLEIQKNLKTRINQNLSWKMENGKQYPVVVLIVVVTIHQ